MKSRGFTLIELMIVVMIVGILVAMIIPQISKRMNQQDTTVIQHQVEGDANNQFTREGE